MGRTCGTLGHQQVDVKKIPKVFKQAVLFCILSFSLFRAFIFVLQFHLRALSPFTSLESLFNAVRKKLKILRGLKSNVTTRCHCNKSLRQTYCAFIKQP